MLIELNQIDMKYNKGQENEVHALKQVSFSVEQGDFVGLVGASGSGKTTLLQIIGGMLRPTGGTYFFDGMDVSAMKDSQLSRFRNQKVGYVLQDYGLLRDRNVVENVCLPMMFSHMKWHDIESRAMKLLTELHIDHLKARRVNQLSGGQSQLVAVARALAMNPPVILADEPTGSLDSNTSAHLMESLIKLNNAGVTILMVTHNEEISKQCKRIVRIRDGQLLAE